MEGRELNVALELSRERSVGRVCRPQRGKSRPAIIMPAAHSGASISRWMMFSEVEMEPKAKVAKAGN